MSLFMVAALAVLRVILRCFLVMLKPITIFRTSVLVQFGVISKLLLKFQPR